MSIENEEKGSIWASRSSPDSALNSFVPRRARAGTLPSRLPSRIDTSIRDPPTSHLGSLALISPDGNDIVSDSYPSCSRSAVGQQPTATSDHSVLGSNGSTATTVSGVGSGNATSSGSSGNSNGSATSSGSIGLLEKRRSPPLAPIPEPSAALDPAASSNNQLSSSAISTSGFLATPPTLGRARSGSLNSLAMRAQSSSASAFHPFPSSRIWGPSASMLGASPTNGNAATPGYTTAAAGSTGATNASSGSSGSSPLHHTGSNNSNTASNTSSVGGSTADLPDPMLIFANELNRAPQRLRSYTTTLDSGSDWGMASAAAALPSNGGIPFAQRARSQTLMPQGAASIPLSRFAHLHPHQLHVPTAAGSPSRGHSHSHSLSLSEHAIAPDVYVTGDYSPTPTPAICISNVPPQAAQLSLHTLFAPFGKIEYAQIVPARRCAYVVFASTIQAIEAQATANGAELYVGSGPSTVTFAQVVSPNASAESFVGTSPQQRHLSPDHATTVNGIHPMHPHHHSHHQNNHHNHHPAQQHHSQQQQQHHNTAGLSLHTGFDGTAKPLGSSSSTNIIGGLQHSGSSSTSQQLLASAVPLPATATPAPVSVAYILQTLNADRAEINSGIEHLQRASTQTFDAPVKPLAESLAVDPGTSDRTYNAAMLRDLRRRLETMPQREVDEVALDMQRELPALASDYIGNTTVQLVFERSSSDVRDMMLRRLVDVFAATGTHKNGTWAVQKMIDLARGPRQYALVEKAIRPHLVALLLDQFGNYVVQGCLKFGTPYSDFVYSGIATALAKVAPNRFGARAVRAVLESEHTTAANQRLVATAIVQQIAALATNPNGCLLVSWLLDNFERSDPDMHLRTHSLVAAQLVPQHLAAMCSSKLGSGIVLKLAASPSSSSHRVFDALLEPLTDRLPAILVEVLEDPSGQGASCVYRLMTTVFPPQSLERQVTVNKVRMCLLRPGARIPNHKRLLEEVGLNMLHPEVKENGSSGIGRIGSDNGSGHLNHSAGTSGSDHHHHRHHHHPHGTPTPPNEIPVIHSNKSSASTSSLESAHN